jgi:hypothetical protein
MNQAAKSTAYAALLSLSLSSPRYLLKTPFTAETPFPCPYFFLEMDIAAPVSF